MGQVNVLIILKTSCLVSSPADPVESDNLSTEGDPTHTHLINFIPCQCIVLGMNMA